MSFKNLNFVSIINNLKFDENVDSFVPPTVFLVFGHFIMHRLSVLFINHGHERNLTKFKQMLFVLSLHMQVLCFWFLFVQIFRAITQISNLTITSCEIKYTIQSIMTITYLIVAFFPMGFTIIEYMDQKARIFIEYTIATELGVEGMILSGSHRHIQEVNRPLAYQLKRSTSSFMLRECESANTMHRSKTVVELEKISIEDLVKL